MSLIKVSHYENELNKTLSILAMWLEEAIEIDEQSRCASCGATDSLTSGYAGGNLINYCPVCKADEEQS